MNTDSEVKVLWEVRRNDPSDPPTGFPLPSCRQKTVADLCRRARPVGDSMGVCASIPGYRDPFAHLSNPDPYRQSLRSGRCVDRIADIAAAIRRSRNPLDNSAGRGDGWPGKRGSGTRRTHCCDLSLAWSLAASECGSRLQPLSIVACAQSAHLAAPRCLGNTRLQAPCDSATHTPGGRPTARSPSKRFAGSVAATLPNATDTASSLRRILVRLLHVDRRRHGIPVIPAPARCFAAQ